MEETLHQLIDSLSASITGFYTSQVVQDSCYQQHHNPCSWTSLERVLGRIIVSLAWRSYCLDHVFKPSVVAGTWNCHLFPVGKVSHQWWTMGNVHWKAPNCTSPFQKKQTANSFRVQGRHVKETEKWNWPPHVLNTFYSWSNWWWWNNTLVCYGDTKVFHFFWSNCKWWSLNVQKTMLQSGPLLVISRLMSQKTPLKMGWNNPSYPFISGHL